MTTKTQTTTRKPAVRTNKRGAVLMTKPDPETEPAAIATVADVATQLAEVEGMTVRQLHTKFFEVFGEPTRSNSKPYLQRKISYRIQELAEGGLSASAGARIDELAETTPLRRRPAKHYPAPAGTDDGAAGEPTATGLSLAVASARHATAPRTVAARCTVWYYDRLSGYSRVVRTHREEVTAWPCKEACPSSITRTCSFATKNRS